MEEYYEGTLASTYTTEYRTYRQINKEKTKMKKIINNKLYNTDTANRLIYWYNDLPSNDGYYYAEELYIKKTGEYFLYGEGGARSPYGSYDCEERCSYPDWSIIPLTEAKAKEWAVDHCSADKYMELFGAVAE